MNGVIIINKPIGITSFDVVFKVRKMAKTKKVGHTGTLDPLASGVLPICIGNATKLVDYIMIGEKQYKATLKLGVVTDTYDLEGKVIRTSDVSVTPNEVITVINGFIGESQQIPPMYSAIKVNGKKLYELARKGIEIEREKRKISIAKIQIHNIELPFVSFTVNCSKGTYIRSLCYDIGEILGCGATMTELERSGSGDFKIENSVKLEDLTQETIENHLIGADTILKRFEALTVSDKFLKLLLNGVVINDKTLVLNLKSDTSYRVYNQENSFIGIGENNHYGFKLVLRFI